MGPHEASEQTRLTLAAALHMSATILPDTRVSKMLVVAKLKTFSRATCSNSVPNVFTHTDANDNEKINIKMRTETSVGLQQ